MFDSACAFVDFSQPLIDVLSVRAALRFQADLTLCGLSDRQKEERAASFVREFDLVPYNDVLIRELNEAARRRLLLCMHLIRDPAAITVNPRKMRSTEGFVRPPARRYHPRVQSPPLRHGHLGRSPMLAEHCEQPPSIDQYS
ncbi:unnamed protein product [Gongylonema pulchrum]|uniref:Uncharacterized protein n=1 Tax=Gongylonema pulchrum TaxID=637853 RepID=A0A3P6PMS4_9BILA|nr:unnamed protein product [Gongylonema pulchrum]